MKRRKFNFKFSSELSGQHCPDFVIFCVWAGFPGKVQGCQTYRALCLWERFFLIFDLILIGQFSSNSISLKRLDVRLIGHFRVKIRVKEKSLSQAKCPKSLTALYVRGLRHCVCLVFGLRHNLLSGPGMPVPVWSAGQGPDRGVRFL